MSFANAGEVWCGLAPDLSAPALQGPLPRQGSDSFPDFWVFEDILRGSIAKVKLVCICSVALENTDGNISNSKRCGKKLVEAQKLRDKVCGIPKATRQSVWNPRSYGTKSA